LRRQLIADALFIQTRGGSAATRPFLALFGRLRHSKLVSRGNTVHRIFAKYKSEDLSSQT